MDFIQEHKGITQINHSLMRKQHPVSPKEKKVHIQSSLKEKKIS